MDLLLKLVLLCAMPLLLVVGLVWGTSWLLNIDDLSQCQATPQPASQQCAAADAIVAISGGDTDARTREAIRLYQEGWGSQLIFSGAAQDKTGISNAEAMRQQAIAAGVPSQAILIDEIASDTAGNAAGINVIAQNQQIERLILVTSPYHQRRASTEFARALGPTVTIVNHPTPEDKYWDPNYWWISPYSWYLALTEIGKLLYLNLSGV